MAKKVTLPYDQFKRMAGSDSVKLSNFITNQKIGKIEFTSKPFDNFKNSNSTTKWIVDLSNGSFIKLVDGSIDHEDKSLSVGEAIGEILDLIKLDDKNDYSSVNIFRRDVLPNNMKSVAKHKEKFGESVLKSMIKRLIREELDSVKDGKYVAFTSHRSRDTAERMLGNLPNPKASFRHSNQFYFLSNDQIEKLKSDKRIANVIIIKDKLPGNADDWMNAR